MASRDLDIPVSKLVGDLTMNVTLTGMRTFRIRQWISIQLMKLAALVIGCGIDVDIRE